MTDLKGKNALVTGGSHGIGLAIANELLSQGCNVCILSRNTNKPGIDARFSRIDCNVLSNFEVSRINYYLRLIFPDGIDILINNVGGGGRWGGNLPIEEVEEKTWQDVYNKNAMAAIRFTRYAIPLMKKRKWGRVITIASILGKEAGGKPWFNMAKAAEISLMKTLSRDKDLARSGITFNTIAPGAILIPDTGWDKDNKDFAETLPLGRLGTPEEVAHVAAFLCSDKASLVNGACITVDGGESRSF